MNPSEIRIYQGYVFVAVLGAYTHPSLAFSLSRFIDDFYVMAAKKAEKYDIYTLI